MSLRSIPAPKKNFEVLIPMNNLDSLDPPLHPPISGLRSTCPVCKRTRSQRGCYAFFAKQSEQFGQNPRPKEYCLQPQGLTEACSECQTPPGEYHHFRCSRILCPLPSCGKPLINCHWSHFYAEIRLNGTIYILTILERYDPTGKRQLLPDIKLELKQ